MRGAAPAGPAIFPAAARLTPACSPSPMGSCRPTLSPRSRALSAAQPGPHDPAHGYRGLLCPCCPKNCVLKGALPVLGGAPGSTHNGNRERPAGPPARPPTGRDPEQRDWQGGNGRWGPSPPPAGEPLWGPPVLFAACGRSPAPRLSSHTDRPLRKAPTRTASERDRRGAGFCFLGPWQGSRRPGAHPALPCLSRPLL